MKVALDKVIEIVTDCKPNGETDVAAMSIFTGIKEFKVSMKRMYFCFFSFHFEGALLYVISLFLCTILE